MCASAWIDYTYSFIRGSSTLPIPRFQDRPMPPDTDPVTTIISFEYTSDEANLPFARSGVNDTYGRIDSTTSSGQALSTFVTAIEAEAGFDFWMFAFAEEESECRFHLFIGWETHPSPTFSSLSSFQTIDSSSPLSAFKPHLKSPPKLINIPFNAYFSKRECIKRSRSIELITWTIPPNLDPTVHLPQAKTFELLRQFFTVFRYGLGSTGPGDLYSSSRGWAAGCSDTYQPSKEEPSEKTHVFLLFWKNREAEQRFKDPTGRSLVWGNGRPSDTKEMEAAFWEKTFLAWQKELEAQGMINESLHLRFSSGLEGHDTSRDSDLETKRAVDSESLFAQLSAPQYQYIYR